ncbi:DUF3267 domain-containing protein [uncultured Ruminococcus sp.]|uniref:DUF3267 domain-containing protein n=1 Tax=uncultured Ruminococcus sp. TaxID=165186 RepID=UPI0025E0D507|nr:DUF3267 domain-containing protein [uncultured Ruminococcus sp.]
MGLKNKRCSSALPVGYREIYSVNLQKDKKAALFVNIAALILMVIFVIIGILIVPISYTFDNDGSIVTVWLKTIAVLAGMIVYFFLHELVHGITMKHYGANKVKYGFTGLYAFAGCEEYFSKKPYIVIALAPIVVWGVVLAAICCFVPKSWFWVVYFIQIMNLSGAAGDLYVTCKFSKFPKDILIKDTGVEMKVYSKTL